MAGKRRGRSQGIVKAKSVTVTADSISEPEKIRMTNTHHGSRSEAEGDVRIEIETQYPNAGGDGERPPAGTVLKADKATVQARQILHRGRRGGRDRITAKGNVGIFGKLRRGTRCPL